ncbi:enoyl-CoA hydratase/isomerase family protein [Variovorax paradoxus]|nr:enoyl-CoA hydratase/isomerase family protein [Variovorax paradoxus]
MTDHTNIASSQLEASGRVKVSRSGAIAWIVLDNVRKHNAISLEMWRSLTEALASFETDSDVRCVVIRGEGDQAFCAGADIVQNQGSTACKPWRTRK